MEGDEADREGRCHPSWILASPLSSSGPPVDPVTNDAGGGDRVSLALVHEWVASRAGSEQVFEAMAGIWPEADLFALSRDPDVELDLGGRSVTTTWLDHRWLRDRRGLTLPL